MRDHERRLAMLERAMRPTEEPLEITIHYTIIDTKDAGVTTTVVGEHVKHVTVMQRRDP